jgi:molybdopterin/thiamine biosynthesis adenylyltransferase
MNLERYRRQILLKEIGTAGQELLATKHAIIIGGGGLGSNSASLLIRMGIGTVDIVDFDVVDLTNLHRTAVFTEQDVGKPKAVVLEQKLESVNRAVIVKARNQKVTSKNIAALIKDADIVLDGTDSIQLRFLINNASLMNNIPWVYAGVSETIGMVMGILPMKTPCFQCIAQDLHDPTQKEFPVLGSLPSIIAAIQCTEAMKILLGRKPKGLVIYDVWNQCFDTMDVQRNPKCQSCGKNNGNTKDEKS